MAWNDDEIKRVLILLTAQLGKTYAIGGPDKNGQWVVRGKPSISNLNPDNFDCSGLSRWIIAQGRDEYGKVMVLPDGCREQIKVCRALANEPRLPLDLGFAALHHQEPDHVIIVADEAHVIEARGQQQGKDYGKVIQRPIPIWEAQKGFLGWWRVPGVRK